jgi:PAS domain S-box-containing protein
LEGELRSLEGQASASRSAEALLRSILDTVPDYVIKLSPDGTIHFVNRVAPGLALKDFAGESVYSYIDPAHVETARGVIETVTRTGVPGAYATVGTGPHGKPAHYLTRLAPIKRGSEVESLVMVATDVTALEEARAHLSESREKLDLAAFASGVGLWSWQRAGDTLVWDAATCRIFGVETAPDSFGGYLELVHPGDRDRLEVSVVRALGSGTFDDIEHRIIRPDGQVRWLLCKGRVELDETRQAVRMVGGTIDVTDRHQLQEQLLQSQKMEAVGQLAAGIAHNFNNMLTVMLSSMELAARKSGGEAAAILQEGQRSALRAAQIVRQLMVFSKRPRGANRRLEDIGAVVRRTVEMSQTTFGDEITLSVSLGQELPTVRCDSGQIEQALLNVLINARDALEGVEGRAREIRVVVESVRAGAGGGAGEVRVSVSDNGCGMTEAVRQRVFEPFFTTKEPGKGTGLGLATSYAILSEHGGRLECASTDGEGTRVDLFLLAEADVGTLGDEPALSAPRSGRGERVLVVDDEPMIRDLMSQVLGAAGYQVDTAIDGIDAIERVRPDVERYQVVLLDQSMPRLAGRAALRALRGMAPRLKIVCFSGFPANLEGADAVLEKPVPEQVLLETLGAVLRRRG